MISDFVMILYAYSIFCSFLYFSPCITPLNNAISSLTLNHHLYADLCKKTAQFIYTVTM